MANPESVEYLNQARYFVGVEKYDDALEYISKAIAVDKLNKESYVQKSIILANLEQYKDAIEELKNASKIVHWLAIDGYKSGGSEIWIIDPAKSTVISWSNDKQLLLHNRIKAGIFYADQRNYMVG